MWKYLFLLLIPAAPIVVGATAHERTAQPEPACRIDVQRNGSLVQLAGTAGQGAPAAGSYAFEVRKIGPAGTSQSVQSGEYNLRIPSEGIGTVGLSLEPGARYEATLTLRGAGSETRCEVRGGR